MAFIPSTITSQLGPLGLLPAQLRSFIDNKNSLPQEVCMDGIDIEGIVKHLEEISNDAMDLILKAENHSFRAKCWTNQVRELSFDIADLFDMAILVRAGVHSSSATQVINDISKLSARLHQVKQIGKSLVCDHDIPKASIDVPVSQLQNLPEAGLIEKTMKELTEFMVHKKQTQNNVVSIVGFAGVGKTTVARKLYLMFGRGFDCRALLRMSRNLDTRMLLISMLSQIKGRKPHGFSEVHDLLHHIKEHLKGRTYFIVIDEIWDASAWDIIRRAFPEADSQSTRSTIITATQTEDVALACCGYNRNCIFNMDPQNKDEQQKIFFSTVFGPGYDHQELEKVLARESNFLMEKRHMQHSLSSTVGTNPTSEAMKEVRNLVYNNLPPHLKTCLLYLNMYPEGCVIKKDDLVKQWVAEGFLNRLENQDSEEVAGTYFDELVSRRLIQPEDVNYKNEVLSCTVHHMVLDLISYKSMEDNFSTNLDCFQSSHEMTDKVRRLSINFGGFKRAKVPRSIGKILQTRSLVFFGFMECVPSVHEYSLLRVLVLHIWADQDNKSLNLAKIGELFLLTYLNINCNMIVILPDKIQELKFLETLEVDARECTVPSDIVDLPRLLHLRLPRNIDLPHEIGHMTSLRSLVHFNLSNSSRDNVLQLGVLTNLRDLHVTCSTLKHANLMESMQCLGSILSELHNLISLTMIPDSSDGSKPEAGTSTTSCDALSIVHSAPDSLQRLELLPRTCTFSILPEWIGELRELRILKIGVEKLSSDDIDILKGLPALTALSLYVQIVPERRIVVNEEGFSVLKYFKFMCAAPRLQFNKGAMCKVRSLRLGFSAKRMERYKLLVAGFEHLTGLEEVSVKLSNCDPKESDRSAVKDALVDAVKNNPMKPVVNVRCVDVGWLSYVDKQKSIAPQDQLQTPEKHDVIADDGTDEYYGTEEKSLWKGDSSKRMAGYPEPFVKDAPSAMRGASSNKGVTVSSPVDSSHMQNPGLDKAGNKAAIAIQHAMGQTGTVAQLVGADAGGLIAMIMQAAVTALQNKKECEQLARRVLMIAELLAPLHDRKVLRRPEVRRPLEGLGDTLREAHELVTSCQGRRWALYRFVTAGRQADRFRDVQSRIDSYLLVLRPFISHIDITRRLDRIYNIPLPNDASAPSEGSQSHSQLPADQEVLFHGDGAEEFAWAALAAATSNFASKTVVSKSCLSTVYNGKLPNGREVAIKRIRRRAMQVPYSDFRNELAVTSLLRHKHIIRPVGWGFQREESHLFFVLKKEEEHLLVYEFMNNSTLHHHLHHQPSSSFSSPVRTSWKTRLEVLLGVSRAIEYLQRHAVPRVIHRNVKSSNVLLDDDWEPLLSNFAVAVTYNEDDEDQGVDDTVGCAKLRNIVVGTVGYLDPEFIRTGHARPSSDVYSFGVLMLEVLTGKMAYTIQREHKEMYRTKEVESVLGMGPYMSLALWALQLIEAGDVTKLLDKRPEVPEPTPRQLEAMELVAHSAASCLRLRGDDRPAISQVVDDLENAVGLIHSGGGGQGFQFRPKFGEKSEI